MQVPLHKKPTVKIFDYPLEMIFNAQIDAYKKREQEEQLNPAPMELYLKTTED